MTLHFEEEGNASLPLDCVDLARTVIDAALEHIGCPYEAEVNLLLTMDEDIRRINKEFRNIDKETDVLSFPAADFKIAGDFDFLEEAYDCFHPETGELLLGDIVISKERVLSQAEEYGHSIRREYSFLIAHSMLHLMGYDHMDEAGRFAMEKKQREILDRLKILR